MSKSKKKNSRSWRHKKTLLQQQAIRDYPGTFLHIMGRVRAVITVKNPPFQPPNQPHSKK
jgi:hypothetical protein